MGLGKVDRSRQSGGEAQAEHQSQGTVEEQFRLLPAQKSHCNEGEKRLKHRNGLQHLLGKTDLVRHGRPAHRD